MSANSGERGGGRGSFLENIHVNLVFVVSVVIGAAIGTWGVIAPEQMTGAATLLTDFAVGSLDWFFLLLCTSFLVLALFMAFGPYAHIKLGKDDDVPEFSVFSWIAMLFAGGMGAGLLFWGVAEPIHHFHAPPGMEGDTAAAARWAMVTTNLHWGLHAWSIYGVCALVIAYFSFRFDRPSLISTPIRQAFGGRYINFWCNTADIIGVLAVVFGLAGSLTMGVLQVRAGLGEVFETPSTFTVSLIILITMTVVFVISASTGVDKGIKYLSNINMVVAALIMVAVIFVGPTRFILDTFVNTVGDYFSSLLDISFRLFSYEGLTGWGLDWTLTFLIWWLAWGPFVGLFIARISRGRTIREFCLGVILVPTILSILWFSAFGGSAIYIELFGTGGLTELVFEDTNKALFAYFTYFPFNNVLSVMAVFLVFVFLVTSADSGTFVVSMMTTNGSLNPPTAHKLLWAAIIAAITAGTLFSGSVSVAKTMAVTGAIPFSLILILQIIAFLRVIRLERRGPSRERVITGTAQPRGGSE